MKILIIDDHALVRDAMAQAMQQLEVGAEVLVAGDRDEALALIAAHSDLDLVVLDLSLPGVHGLSFLHEIRGSYPSIPVAILSGIDDPEMILRCLETGAVGYIQKSSSTLVILNALRMMLAGDVYIPSSMIEGGRIRRVVPGTRRVALTDRHRQILSLVAAGHSNKEIARRLRLSEATIKAHLAAIFRILNVNNRTQAVFVARQLLPNLDHEGP
ncbi:MAG: response regulator transcription factor [Acidiferrobacteraceae bacterium]